MIEYAYEAGSELVDSKKYTKWLEHVVTKEGASVGAVCYIFSTDEKVREINKEYLDHDYYTDIITFNYNSGDTISGDIFISVERVADNAKQYKAAYEEELRRVMVHGILHLLGYNDGTAQEKATMRRLEEEKLKMFHVEQ
jgi:rRNA maturation RNase YbeY